MTMTHPGLPVGWVWFIGLSMLLLVIWTLRTKPPGHNSHPLLLLQMPLQHIPLIGGLFAWLNRRTWPLLILKIVFALLFLLIIFAGLSGTAIPERNLATTLTWNLWWSGVVIAILFTGSAWCAVCPWDNIANWLVKRSIWRRASTGSSASSSLSLTVPTWLRNLWPATFLFAGLTWLELGVGIVASPYTTALLALAMIVAATMTLALFENKAFCRYMCPVGRTIGVYSQLAPIALRSIDADICKSCKTLECYHGNDKIAPCPTGLIIGRLQESTYCTSCGNCTQSCPSQNVGWQIRTPSVEAIQDARPHLDEAFFMLVLLVLTSFHGLTMLDGWQSFISDLGQSLGDSGILLLSFTLGLSAYTIVPIGLYALVIDASRRLINRGGTLNHKKRVNYKKLFAGFAFTTLPLAFSYHLAHNLNHLLREGADWAALLANPLGTDTLPLSMMEKHMRHMTLMLPESVLFGLQAILMTIGFALAIQIIRHRGYRLFAAKGVQLLPMILFAAGVTSFNLWMLIQPMVMRM
ncbi:MAG: polyferredoxin [Phenylobacterium sp.]|jgi:polyferredoxin